VGAILTLAGHMTHERIVHHIHEVEVPLLHLLPKSQLKPIRLPICRLDGTPLITP
jgi:hypothetical protein